MVQILHYLRVYSMLHNFKQIPSRIFVRELFGNAKERQQKREKMWVMYF